MRISLISLGANLLFLLSRPAQLLFSFNYVASATPLNDELSSISLYQGSATNTLLSVWMEEGPKDNFFVSTYGGSGSTLSTYNTVLMSIDKEGHILDKKSFGPSNGNFISQQVIQNNTLYSVGRWLDGGTYRPMILKK